MPSKPDKTIHEDLGLTAASDFDAPIDESLRGDPGDFLVDDTEPLEAPESAWTWRRVSIAATIVAVAAAELFWALSVRDSLEEQRRKAEALPESEKAGLEAKRERFEKLDAVEQDRLRRLQAEMSSDADPASLDATLTNYLAWKSQLPPQESALLAGLEPTKRTEQVAALADREFSEQDSKKLVLWLESEVRKYQTKILATLPTPMRERFEGMGDRERSFALMYHFLSTRGNGARMEEIAGDLPKLRAQLSPAAQARWDAAAAKSKDEFRILLTDWIRQSFERGVIHRDGGRLNIAVKEEDLQRFFQQEISDAERKRLMALPKEDMISQLRREYFRRKGNWKDPDGKPMGFGGRPFGPIPDDGRGGPPRRPPDDGRAPPHGPGMERRPPNGEPPPPPMPRHGDLRGEPRPNGSLREGGRNPGGPPNDRDNRFGPDGKPLFEPNPNLDKRPGADGSRRDQRRNLENKPDAPPKPGVVEPKET
jgi:hypothetical protein